MRRAAGCSLLLILAVTLVSGCSDDTKHQFGLRGKWQLEQRALTGGKVLKPPIVSGLWEWYPVSITSAHITASVSVGEHQIQVSTYTLEFVGGDISRTEWVRIQGGYGTSPQPTYQTPNETVKGTGSSEGNSRTLAVGKMSVNYPDVSEAVVEDATFTVTFSDGTVDTWRRTADQLGVLPK